MSSDAPIATLYGVPLSLRPKVQKVYVRNLEERVKPDPLHEALEAIFSEFGTIVDIVAKTNLKAKGQAFIVYDDPEAARRAVEEAQGFVLFDKPMVLALARTRSDATVRRHGTEEEFEAHKRRRMAERDKKKALEAAEEQKRLLQRPPPGAPAAGVLPVGGVPAGAVPGAVPGAAAGAAAAAPAVIPDEYLPPNKTLFVQNLPADADVDKLTEIFGRFEGFREVRVVPGRRLAFVEYEAEPGAIAAKENTAGMVLDSDGNAEEVDDEEEKAKRAIKVTYQRQ